MVSELRGSFREAKPLKCLNPCSSGRWSRSGRLRSLRLSGAGLNPCSSGRWSRSEYEQFLNLNYEVLILVLVEDGLGGLLVKRICSCFLVLILVLVEDGLGDFGSRVPVH